MNYYKYKVKRGKLKKFINYLDPGDDIPFEYSFITNEYADEVSKKCYKYYKMHDYPKFDRIVSKFEPNEDDIFRSPKDASSQIKLRVIFAGKYSNEEIQKYEEYMQKVEELEDAEVKKQLKSLWKDETMHMIQSLDYDLKKIIKEYNKKITEIDSLEPTVLNDKMRDLLDKGFFYVHGHDRSLRPVRIFRPNVIYEWKAEIDDAIKVIHFVNKYCFDHLFVPGKIEAWITIVDLKLYTGKMVNIPHLK